MKITRAGTAGGILLAVMAALLAACGSGGGNATASSSSTAANTPLDHTVKITYLYTPATTSAPAFVAAAKGYFKDEHLDVTLKPFTTDPASELPLLATEKIDAMGTSSFPALFNQIANNVDVRFVAAAGAPKPGSPTSAFVVKADGPIKQVSDLKGQKVALIGGAQTVSGYYLNELLKQGGLTINDVQVVNLDFASGLAAVKTGAVAATLQVAPTWQQDVASGQYKVIGDMDPVYAHGSPSGVMFGPSLLRNDRQAGVAFLRALQRAASTDLQGDYLAKPDIAKAIADGLGIPVADVQKLTPPVFNPKLTLNPDVFQSVQQFWIGLSALAYQKPVPASSVIDQQLIASAEEPTS